MNGNLNTYEGSFRPRLLLTYCPNGGAIEVPWAAPCAAAGIAVPVMSCATPGAVEAFTEPVRACNLARIGRRYRLGGFFEKVLGCGSFSGVRSDCISFITRLRAKSMARG